MHFFERQPAVDTKTIDVAGIPRYVDYQNADKLRQTGEPYCIPPSVWKEMDRELYRIKIPTCFGDKIRGIFDFRKANEWKTWVKMGSAQRAHAGLIGIRLVRYECCPDSHICYEDPTLRNLRPGCSWPRRRKRCSGCTSLLLPPSNRWLRFSALHRLKSLAALTAMDNRKENHETQNQAEPLMGMNPIQASSTWRHGQWYQRDVRRRA